MKLIQSRYKDIPLIKQELLIKQDNKCKICGIRLDTNNPKNIHLDHEHFGDKRIRAVLCRRCNTCEGKLWNSYLRTTNKEQRSKLDYLKMLRGLVKYASHKPTKFIHPKAIPKKRRKK